MRLEECAMWDLDKVTWEGRVEAMGTIPVCVCAQVSWGEGTGVLAGKLGKGTVWVVEVLGFGTLDISGPIKTRVKHLFSDVVRAMMSLSGSIVASLKNINGFLAMNTPPDDLICRDFKQEGVVPKVKLHIFEEFVWTTSLSQRSSPYGSLRNCQTMGRTEYLSQEDGLSARLSSKILYESSIETGTTEKTSDTVDGSGMR
uniref:Uncharacterized protein n=1 Tax=Tanacetum cinerariifolium TaxID=118510 RepID=A0A699I0B0_TANCI|nr:hypothetical protein [Tanacetum cinerariifolium]